MKVVMTVGISGGRGDGTAWPPAGGVLEVDDDEGAQLIAGRMAVAVPEPPPPPAAVKPKESRPAPDAAKGTAG